MALEENVREFGLTYFGMTDRRQGKNGSFAPHLTPLAKMFIFQVLYISSDPNKASLYVMSSASLSSFSLFFISSLASHVYAVILIHQVSDTFWLTLLIFSFYSP
jgi:hypothetical protein